MAGSIISLKSGMAIGALAGAIGGPVGIGIGAALGAMFCWILPQKEMGI